MNLDLQREMRAYGRHTEIAKKLGVSVSYVSMMYLGKKPPSTALLDLIGLERITTTKYRRKRQETTNEQA